MRSCAVAFGLLVPCTLLAGVVFVVTFQFDYPKGKTMKIGEITRGHTMSDLEDALNYWSGMEEMSTCDRRHLRRIVDAARLVANPNYEAARETLDKLYDLGVGIPNGFAVKSIVDAALTPREDTP